MIRAGELTRTVKLQKLSTTADSSGLADETAAGNWVTYALRSCSIATQGSREFLRAGQVAADVTHLVLMRYDSVTRALSPRHRLVLGTRIFNIASEPVDLDDKHVVVRLACVESAGAG
ncbi:MAG: head-tail adaptor protein [Caulobacteraceae bacterium]|nr:head-tail adaptor protein [Caulobacteraceae bacterium]